jgi:hypothetical protein
MDALTNLELYHSGSGDSLYKTRYFIYKIEVSKLCGNKFELLDTQFVSFKDYKEIKPSKCKKLSDGSTIYKEIELYGAPESYLIENNYEKTSN